MIKQAVSGKINLKGTTLQIENQYTKQSYYGVVVADDGKELRVNVGDDRIYTFTRNTVWNFSFFRYFGE